MQCDGPESLASITLSFFFFSHQSGEQKKKSFPCVSSSSDGPPWGMAFSPPGPTSGSENLLLFFLHTSLTLKDFSGRSSPFNPATSDSARHIHACKAMGWEVQFCGLGNMEEPGSALTWVPTAPGFQKALLRAKIALGAATQVSDHNPSICKSPPRLHGHQVKFKI